MPVPLGALKALIRDAQKGEIICFAPTAVGAILGQMDRWQDRWSTVFRRILARIKTGQGLDDANNEGGKYLSLPIGDHASMAVFFKLLETGQYLIYDLEVTGSAY